MERFVNGISMPLDPDLALEKYLSCLINKQNQHLPIGPFTAQNSCEGQA